MTAMSGTKGHHKWAAKRGSTRRQHKGAAHREALQFAFTENINSRRSQSTEYSTSPEFWNNRVH